MCFGLNVRFCFWYMHITVCVLVVRVFWSVCGFHVVVTHAACVRDVCVGLRDLHVFRFPVVHNKVCGTAGVC